MFSLWTAIKILRSWSCLYISLTPIIVQSYEITHPKEMLIWGGDKEVPEFQNFNEPWKDFILRKLGFEFMKPLVADMIQPDPAKCPKMGEVVTRFDDIRRGLSYRKLRFRVVDVDEDLFERVVRTTSHWKRLSPGVFRLYLVYLPRNTGLLLCLCCVAYAFVALCASFNNASGPSSSNYMRLAS
ncbi:hypothetical protein OG21DRAFT_1568277 [Imleria badia]|nr:hypothetical protein OG21DRAFT_1568277 [Imleria badia]